MRRLNALAEISSLKILFFLYIIHNYLFKIESLAQNRENKF